jgi:cell division protease FtsH
MSEDLGPLTYGDEQEQVFLGREIATHRDYSEETARLIDQEVKNIVADAFDRAIEILRDNEDVLDRLAEALLEREILDNEEIRRLIEGKELKERPPTPTRPRTRPPEDRETEPEEERDEEGGVEREDRVPADTTARASQLAKREGGRAPEESPLPSDR